MFHPHCYTHLYSEWWNLVHKHSFSCNFENDPLFIILVSLGSDWNTSFVFSLSIYVIICILTDLYVQQLSIQTYYGIKHVRFFLNLRYPPVHYRNKADPFIFHSAGKIASVLKVIQWLLCPWLHCKPYLLEVNATWILFADSPKYQEIRYSKAI